MYYPPTLHKIAIHQALFQSSDNLAREKKRNLSSSSSY